MNNMTRHMRQWWGYPLYDIIKNPIEDYDIIGTASYQKYCQYVLNYFHISVFKPSELILPTNIHDIHLTTTVRSGIHSVDMHLYLYENMVKNNYLFIDTDIIADDAIDITPFNLQCKYLFISGGDENILTDISHKVKFEHCFTTNLAIADPRYSPLPVGSRFCSEEDNIFYKKAFEQHTVKTKDVYVNFQLQTNPLRPSILDTCKDLGFVNNCRLIDLKTFAHEMWQHFFAVSPESNPIDSSRTWDALYSRTIPIVKRSIVTEFYSRIFPMIILDDWAELHDYKFDFTLYKQIMNKYENYEYYLDCKNLFHYLLSHINKDT